jgi:hypothetical protein
MNCGNKEREKKKLLMQEEMGELINFLLSEFNLS